MRPKERDPWADLAADTAALGIALPPRFEAHARVFISELGRWNRVGRLTGYRTEGEQVEGLVLESLVLLSVLIEPASPLLDIGSGPGIPGLVLKLARPDWEVTLVEANRRRATFLRHVVRRLDLRGITVLQNRAEALTSQADLRGAFRTVTMRAVAMVERAVALGEPFLASGGRLVIPLGPGGMPPAGIVREVQLPAVSGRLPRRRAFLIIAATEGGSVPRGTRRQRGARVGGRQPEGRRREDHHRGESGGGTRRGRAADAPGRL
ncbi:MAG: 16S rRNA (guanine(527)-N(7))-methyltransferase RsmG [Candidatus Rokuibacteriota bacterium]